MAEPLSSFAISIAAGIVLEIYPTVNKFRTQGVDKQIKVAFDKALRDWSLNEGVRGQKERELISLLQSHIKTGDMITPQIVNQETLDFIKHFEKRLAEQTQAYNYLKSIVGQKRHDEMISSFSRMEGKLSDIETLIKEGGIDPRDVSKWLDKISYDNSREEIKSKIQNWYDQRDISLELKEILSLAIKKGYDKIDELSQEIEELKLSGDFYLAETLEKIKIAVEERKPESLIATYEAYKKKEKEAKINLLNELIESSKTIFAYKEIIQFYKDLIQLEPSVDNHFNFGYFLKGFNFFDEAIQQYEKALVILRRPILGNSIDLSYLLLVLNNLANLQHKQNKLGASLKNHTEALRIRRYLVKEYGESFMPDLAYTLNNIGLLQRDLKMYPEAFKNYKESLEIRRGLVKNNTKKYSYAVAMTLNNLAILQHKNQRDFLNSSKNHKEAIEIYRTLAKENPREFLPYVANSLNNLALVQNDDGKFSLAINNYEESLQYYKKLVKENPRTYDIEYAKMLIEGVVFFKKDKSSIIKAKELLLKYPSVYRAQYFLKTINNFENGKTP